MVDLTLTDEQRQQADQLSRDAEQANRDGKYGEAIRSYYHGLAVMRGVSWTPAFEFASSLQGRLDHALAAPGDTVTVTLSPLYKGDGAKMTAALDADGMPVAWHVRLSGPSIQRTPPSGYTDQSVFAATA